MPPIDGPPVVAFAGPSNSGKTELVCRLLERLGPELRIATLKHDVHGASLGPEGKDTRRHLDAGARQAVLLGPGGVFSWRRDPIAPQAIVQGLSDYDLVLVEGFKRGPFPTVWVGPVDRARELAPGKHFVAFVGEQSPEELDVPWYARDDIDGVADLVRRMMDDSAERFT